MNDLIKKYKVILLILIIVTIFIIPIILNNIIITNSALTIAWSADAILSFYGVLVAAAWAIWGVHITIKDSRENHEKEKVNSVLPFIAFTKLKVKFVHPFLGMIAYHNDKSQEEKGEQNVFDGYQEEELKHLWFQIDNGKIEYLANLSQEQQDNLYYAGVHHNQGKNFDLCTIPLCIPFVLKNVGLGAAIDVRIGLNKKEKHSNTATQSMLLSMGPNDEFKLHIFAETPSTDNDILGEYELKVQYKNIFGDLYQQVCSINLQHDNKNEESKGIVITLGMTEEQTLIQRNLR